jgi:hypothetical protein
MGQLGAAGQDYQPDPQMDSFATQILQTGTAIQTGDSQFLLKQAIAPSGCTATSQGQTCH